MNFTAGIHVGIQNLDSPCFLADTLFSALCQEAIRTDEGIEYFVDKFRNQQLQISDTMFFCDEKYYIPKPMLRIEGKDDGSSIEKKAFKKLKSLQIKHLHDFLKGKLDPIAENKENSNFGAYDIRTNAVIDENGQAVPYQSEVFRFNKGCGLYFCVRYKDDGDLEYLQILVQALSYSGIGGKRSRGLGRFQYEIVDMPEELLSRMEEKKGTGYISLAISLPVEGDLKEICKASNYRLIRRGGFVASRTYAESFQKKKDCYCFSAGSYFPGRFKGDIYNVSNKYGAHPVYQYAIPFFMEV